VVDASLRRLDTDRVDLLYQHRVGRQVPFWERSLEARIIRGGRGARCRRPARLDRGPRHDPSCMAMIDR
jgi:hypothetical protein